MYERKDYRGGLSKDNSNLRFMGNFNEDPSPGSLFGQMTDINVWNTSFTPEDVVAWAQCKMVEGGNIVKWDTAVSKTMGLEEFTIDRVDVCRQQRGSQLIVSEIKQNFNKTVTFCKEVLGGEMAVAVDNATTQEMTRVIEAVDKHKCSRALYSGFTDRIVEGHFLNINTNEEMNWTNWGDRQQNNLGNVEHYTLLAGEQNWDVQGYDAMCPICHLEDLTQFQLRGFVSTAMLTLSIYCIKVGHS